MEIQDTIKELGLEGETLPRLLTQRVGAVENLQNKLQVAQSEYDENPTDENQEKLDEVKDYISEYTDDVVSQLKRYRKKLDKKNEESQNGNSEPKKTGGQPKETDEPKEKKNSGVGLLIGGVLLVATLGAVNILKNK